MGSYKIVIIKDASLVKSPLSLGPRPKPGVHVIAITNIFHWFCCILLAFPIKTLVSFNLLREIMVPRVLFKLLMFRHYCWYIKRRKNCLIWRLANKLTSLILVSLSDDLMVLVHGIRIPTYSRLRDHFILQTSIELIHKWVFIYFEILHVQYFKIFITFNFMLGVVSMYFCSWLYTRCIDPTRKT